MPIEYQPTGLNKIFEDLNGNKLVLPNFQRGFVWNTEKQTGLLSSALVNLPIGSILILEGDAEDFTKRELCYPSELTIDNDCSYVLDGQQRLSTLRSVFYDLYSTDDWRSTWDKLFGALRKRWFVRVKPLEGEEDYFGFTRLQFDTIHKLTDSDLFGFIVPRHIYKTKLNQTHHPAYAPEDANGAPYEVEAEIKNAKAKAFASEHLIPLWELSEGSDGLHWKVAIKIAENRVEDLKVSAEVAGHTVQVYADIFSSCGISPGEIQDELQDKLVDGQLDSTAFSGEWARLSAAWQAKLCTELQKVIESKIATIQLDRGEVNRAVAIFEAINRGGEPLSVFDLIVARSARDQAVKNLSSRIIEKVETPIEVPEVLSHKFHQNLEDNGVALWLPASMEVVNGNDLSSSLKDWFVNVLSLIVHSEARQEESKVEQVKKERILALTPAEVNQYSDEAITAVIRALAFLQIRCGVIKANDVSYKLMLVVLAFHLRNDDVWRSNKYLNKLEYWYWICLMGGHYYARQTERCIEDIKDVSALLDGGPDRYVSRRQSVLDFPEYVTEDILLRREDTEPEQRSVQLAILQYVMSKGPRDLLGQGDQGNSTELVPWSISNDLTLVEVHHIVPLGNAAKIGQSTKELRSDPNHILNSALNKVYISKEANRLIRDKTPSDYLSLLENLQLASHMLPEVSDFRAAFDNGDYEALLAERFKLLKSSVLQHISALE